MKQYYITSLYSQSLQVAIQQDHAFKRMVRDLLKPKNRHSIENDIFDEYINEHETTIALGVSQPMEVLSLYAFMNHHKEELKIPFGLFQEPSMNYTPTAVTFITNEKLSQPIAGEIRNILKDAQIRSFYDIKEECTLTNFANTMTIHVRFNEHNRPVFDVEFVKAKFKSMQNDDLIPKELTDEYLESIYEAFYTDDALYEKGEYVSFKKPNESELYKATYSLTEIVFLDIISRYRLK